MTLGRRAQADGASLEGAELSLPALQPQPFGVRAVEPSPCSVACPAGINVKSYVSLIAEGRFAEALEVVRAQSQDPSMQGFARLNMGNVYLDRGDLAEAIEHFDAVVASGLAEKEVRFRMVYFNLGVAHGLSGAFEESRSWFARLQREMPHKRTMVARELELRQNLRNILDENPSEAARYAEQFPAWFPISDSRQQTRAS